MINLKIPLPFLMAIMCIVLGNTRLMSQDIIIQQNTEGQSRADARGQVFVPAEFGDGVGNTFGQTTVYLNTFSVYYVGTTLADRLYIYETLPSSIASLDAGTGGVLVGESFVNEAEAGKTTYHFGNLALGTNTTYYAVFRQDVELSYGEDIAAAGPYVGGKMLLNNGAVIVENDFTALQFSAELSLTENVNQSDLNALIALYKATDGANWFNKWDLTEDPLNWYNVGWDRASGRVTSLQLGKNTLSGRIPPEIGNLTKLASLNLSGGHYPEIPREIGNLIELRSLDLFACELEGEIPEEFWNLRQLTDIRLERNFLSGEISENINNLTNLRTLNLRNNNLTFLPLLALPAIEEIDIIGNFMQFDSFEQNIDLINRLDLVYVQKNIPYDAQVYQLGVEHTLSVEVAGENNLYQWFKNTVPITEIISDPNYTLTAPGIDDEGIYSCKIVNTLVTKWPLATERFSFTYPVKFDADASRISRINATSAEFDLKLNRTGTTVFYIALPAKSPIPSEEQIIMGLDADNNMANISGSNFISQAATLLSINGFEFNTAYDFYIVSRDGFQVTTDLITFSATTIEPVKFNTNSELTYVGAARTTFDVNLNRSATLYWVVLDEDISPTAGEIISGLSGTRRSIEIALANEDVEVEVTDFLVPSSTHYLTMVAVDNEGFETVLKKYEITTSEAIKYIDGYLPKALHTTGDRVQMSAMVNQDAALYYAVFEGDVNIVIPTLEQLLAGTDGNGNTAKISGTESMSANTLLEFEVSGFADDTKYQIVTIAQGQDALIAQDFVIFEDISVIAGLDLPDFSTGELNIYPNPVENQLTIDLIADERYEISITNLNGQVIYEGSNFSAQQLIDLSDLKKGIYLLNIETKNKSGWKRLIKK